MIIFVIKKLINPQGWFKIMELNFHLTILATVALLSPICLSAVVNAEIEILQQEVIAQNIKFQTPEIREQG